MDAITALKDREKRHEAAALAIENRLSNSPRPSPYLLEARSAHRQAAAATAQAANARGEQRLSLLRVASAFAEAGEALSELGSL